MRIFDRKIKMLGRAGIIYKNLGIEYLVNSECLTGDFNDVVIYADDIVVKNKDWELTRNEKIEIAEEVKNRLERMGMRTTIEYKIP